MTSLIIPVVLSGGIGVRLWPISTQFRPKQFLNIADDGLSFFSSTIKRIENSVFGNPVIVCNHSQRFLVRQELNKLECSAADVILEPSSRGTAPALAAAAMHISEKGKDPIITVLSSDHFISDKTAFVDAVKIAAKLAEENFIVTLGVTPDRVETGYGHIRRGAPYSGGHRVAEFIEKPSLKIAKGYFESGEYYWNVGVFIARASTFINEFSKLSPKVLSAAKNALRKAYEDVDFLCLSEPEFSSSPDISIDYAVMEKTTNAAVVNLKSDWTDVGSWRSLAELGKADNNGNVVFGESVQIDAYNNYIHSERQLMAVMGLNDIALVATEEAVLAIPKSRAQEVRDLVNKINASGKEIASSYSPVYRPWGYYRTVDFGNGFLVKQVVVNPGEKLSLQYHKHRAEHWVVVEGTARVTNDERIFDLSANQSTYIPVGVHHRLENPGDVLLRLIEVQTGNVISEDDIVRLDDVYGRV